MALNLGFSGMILVGFSQVVPVRLLDRPFVLSRFFLFEPLASFAFCDEMEAIRRSTVFNHDIAGLNVKSIDPHS